MFRAVLRLPPGTRLRSAASQAELTMDDARVAAFQMIAAAYTDCSRFEVRNWLDEVVEHWVRIDGRWVSPERGVIR